MFIVGVLVGIGFCMVLGFVASKRLEREKAKSGAEEVRPVMPSVPENDEKGGENE